jgi:hypothetical protein
MENSHLISQKFEQWDKNIEDATISKLKNEKLISKFQNLLAQSKFYKEVPFSEIKNGKNNKLNYSLSCLLFGLENKIQIFMINTGSTGDQEIIAKVYLDHINGGRVGLVHGGCLFFILILNIHIFINKILNLENFNLKQIKTQYKKKVPVNNMVIVRVFTSNSTSTRTSNHTQSEISAEILDSDNEICTKIKCEYQNFSIRKTKF